MAYREFSTGHFAAAQTGAASLEKNRMFTVACVRSGAQKRIFNFSFKEIDAIVSNDRRSERAFPRGCRLQRRMQDLRKRRNENKLKSLKRNNPAK
jgi:hypothetical protein